MFTNIKKLTYSSAFLLLGATVMFTTACKKDFEPTLVEFGTTVEGLAGTWKLQSATQRDEVIEVPDADRPVVDVTRILTKGNAVTVAFDKGTMAYDFKNTLPVNYFGNTGTFSLDDPNYPSNLVFTQASGKKLGMTLGLPIRPEYKRNNLILKWEKYLGKGDDGKPVKALTYTFTFTR
jgi:hypothetical protein